MQPEDSYKKYLQPVRYNIIKVAIIIDGDTSDVIGWMAASYKNEMNECYGGATLQD